MLVITTSTRNAWIELPNVGDSVTRAKGVAWRMFKEDRDGADIMVGEKLSDGMVIIRARRKTCNRRTYWRCV